jgi:hypothetical protein
MIIAQKSEKIKSGKVTRRKMKIEKAILVTGIGGRPCLLAGEAFLKKGAEGGRSSVDGSRQDAVLTATVLLSSAEAGMPERVLARGDKKSLPKRGRDRATRLSICFCSPGNRPESRSYVAVPVAEKESA